ncbi:MAG: molybdopterin-guanine dinucleotide biosynthesis protein B [Candidatus Bathyarchaeota archaeon]|nr:molybdopterin-guanine dinucleotide biosynthesis protein B [Candidatus Termiticorpusculum sp.]
MVLIVAVVGRSGSGKTVVIEYLIKYFSEGGYRVGAVKHVHHRGFTVDTEGKNTWRYAQAGARVVAAVSPDEVAVMFKKTFCEGGDSLDQLIEVLGGELLDIVFIEGYRDLVAKRVDVLKVVTAKDVVCLQEMLEEGVVESILAVSGLVAKNSEEFLEGLKYPVVKVPEEGHVLVDLIKYRMSFRLGKGFEGLERV